MYKTVIIGLTLPFKNTLYSYFFFKNLVIKKYLLKNMINKRLKCKKRFLKLNSEMSKTKYKLNDHAFMRK